MCLRLNEQFNREYVASEWENYDASATSPDVEREQWNFGGKKLYFNTFHSINTLLYCLMI